jgi:hypothetical protein
MENETPQNTVVTEVPQEKPLNIYPALRHLFLIFCILLALSIVFLLLYQNGKSIYENGI